MSNIIINGVREGNLKNISVELPRNKLVVLTGVSGSGKSTLANDVLFQECQRQYLEAIGLQGINKPKLDSARNLSPAVMITQNDANKNPRSTVGTSTNIYTDLRMIYEKLGVRTCPHCGELISSADCKEETEKVDGEFTVYMYCVKCGHRMTKVTRTHFSYNTKEGACPTCEGLGKVLSIHKENTINENLSLEEGAIHFWEQKYKEYQISILYHAFTHYGVPCEPDRKVCDFTPQQKLVLYHGVESKEVKEAFPEIAPPKTVAAGKFEGVYPTLWRKMSEKGGESKQYSGYFNYEVCPECKGERLNKLSRSITVNGTRLSQLSELSLEELLDWMTGLNESLLQKNNALIEAYLTDITTKIRRLMNVGLGYLSLDRQIITLSGGELQRVKLAATLDSDLTGIIYILDEPTSGLHPKDTEGMITILKKLRDLGNTVIVIEHDPDVMEESDYIVDIGPGAGKHGGQIIATGTLEQLKAQPLSITGTHLNKQESTTKKYCKSLSEKIEIKNADKNNLRNIHVNIPTKCMVAVTGVSGSGKSTLVFEVLAEYQNLKQSRHNQVLGMEQFDRVITIEQGAITRMKRSNVATYSEVYTEIRKIYGNLSEAKQKGLGAKHFSFNTPGGRCENCEGLGYITSNMLFFKDQEMVCPVCGGKQFSEEVLSVKLEGHSIKDILQLSVEEAMDVFEKYPKVLQVLKLLLEVGLGYLELGQSLTTLSGGEGQRLKLAKELLGKAGKCSLYLMDEPTAGLHPVDVENFLLLLNRMVEGGNSVIVVEHNLQVIEASDWIIDLGPEGGKNGGAVVFEGTSEDIGKCEQSATGRYMN